MAVYTVHEAKTHFSKLIRQALAGDEVIVSRGRQPVVRIVPLEEAKRDRVPGGAKGLVKDISADFDCPIDEFEEFMR